MNTLANTLNYKTLFHYTFEHFVQNTKLIIKKRHLPVFLYMLVKGILGFTNQIRGFMIIRCISSKILA